MTDFSSLLSLTGLNTEEGALFLNVREQTVIDWRAGRRQPRHQVLEELKELIFDTALVVADENATLSQRQQENAKRLFFMLHRKAESRKD